MPDPSLVDAATVAREEGVDPGAGLYPAEAVTRLARDGANELRETRPVPAWRRFLSKFNDPLIYLLLAAVAISLIAWFADGAAGLPVDAIVIAAVILLNAIIGFVQERRAADAVAALATMTASTSTVFRAGQRVRIPSAELVRGDVLVLGEGDAVGADARIISASALRIMEASLTGESEAADKDPATLSELLPLGDRRNMVFKGTAVT